MDKKLTSKVQRISPKIGDVAKSISKSLVISPDEELSLEKKGTIYVVFDISGKQTLDNLLVTKVVHDVLHDSYYHSDITSPIQAIEKAILKLRDNLTKLEQEENAPNTMATFNIAVAISWGNTLYIVQYGSTKSYLMRSGHIKPISSATEGNFSVASGVIKDNDVVVLATEDFVRKYPPKDLVTLAGIQTEQLDSLQSAIVLKFSVVKAFSESEVIDFGSKIPDKNDVRLSRGERQLQKEQKRSIGPKNLPIKPKKIVALSLAVIIIGALISLFLFTDTFSFITNGEPTETSDVRGVAIETSNNPVDIAEVQGAQDEGESNIQDDESVKRVDTVVFYDLKVTDETANPKEIAFSGDSLYVADIDNGKLYMSKVLTPKFVQDTKTFLGLGKIFNYDDSLAFVDNDGIKITTPNTMIVDQTFEGTFNITSTYLGYLYTVVDNQILKYTISNSTLSEDLWITDPELVGAKSIGINRNIYVVNISGQLLKYFGGEKAAFEITGLEEPITNATQIVANAEFSYIYVLEPIEKRILVLTPEGELVQQLKPENRTIWNDLRQITINDDETIMYVLDGTKVYEVSLDTQKIVEE